MRDFSSRGSFLQAAISGILSAVLSAIPNEDLFGIPRKTPSGISSEILPKFLQAVILKVKIPTGIPSVIPPASFCQGFFWNSF